MFPNVVYKRLAGTAFKLLAMATRARGLVEFVDLAAADSILGVSGENRAKSCKEYESFDGVH
jgi:hypothetical protein